jgi:amino acid permease
MIKTKKTYWNGLFMLAWSTLGAWFFGLPYALTHAWVVPATFFILGVGVIVILLHLILAEVSLSLPGHKTFVGMWRALFPHHLAQITSVASIVNFFIGTLAYIILGWGFLSTLLGSMWVHLHIAWFVLIYTIIVGIGSWKSLQSISKRDNLIVIILMIWIVIIIFGAVLVWWDISSIPTSRQNSFPLYGISLFALTSINAIPLLYESTGKDANKVRSVIVSSGVIVTLLALGFAMAVASISGVNTSQDATHGLYTFGWPVLGLIGSIVGLAAIVTSHFPVAEHLKLILTQDWKLQPLMSRCLITIFPCLIYLYFDPSIMQVLGITGSLLGGILFILVALMNIRLHSTQQKVEIISMVDNDLVLSYILLVLCGIWVLYQIITLY